MGKPIGNRGMGETERERNRGRGMTETDRELGNGGMREIERGNDREGEGTWGIDREGEGQGTGGIDREGQGQGTGEWEGNRPRGRGNREN